MYYLGIDGGGTKTAFILTNQYGESIYRNTYPTIHYMQVGLNGITQIIKEGLNDLLSVTGLHETLIDYAYIGCPGFGDIKDDEASIRDAIAHAMGPIKHRVGNDIENAHAGALQGHDGVCIIAGTGSIGMGVLGEKRIISGGWHHAFGGDEGSAYWIASQYITLLHKQMDGRYPQSNMFQSAVQALTYHFNAEALTPNTILLHNQRTHTAAFSRVVYTLAEAGDPYALEIFQQAAFELIQIIRACCLEPDASVRVSYAGGVFESGNLILDPIKSVFPNTQAPVFSPDIGSVILAFKYANIPLSSRILNNLKTINR
ncbi:ATPase [Erysipelothrix sp. HDW6B]|uniref:N-acetylglucosamine kinase n=1 Tax=Erysipelothrix sp. HDW6B TaxID=2714929 RepID=UPI001409613C|nr:BadF/BadG/BcrA/BcrD ATPase family protein [Erysipelothrix sp. HDW6B]QIK85180.1 ATPase [Erysipelothrix sp. HDW6B]